MARNWTPTFPRLPSATCRAVLLLSTNFNARHLSPLFAGAHARPPDFSAQCNHPSSLLQRVGKRFPHFLLRPCSKVSEVESSSSPTTSPMLLLSHASLMSSMHSAHAGCFTISSLVKRPYQFFGATIALMQPEFLASHFVLFLWRRLWLDYSEKYSVL